MGQRQSLKYMGLGKLDSYMSKNGKSSLERQKLEAILSSAVEVLIA